MLLFLLACASSAPSSADSGDTAADSGGGGPTTHGAPNRGNLQWVYLGDLGADRYTVEVGDLDGDGRDEVLLVDGEGKELSLLRADVPKGTFVVTAIDSPELKAAPQFIGNGQLVETGPGDARNLLQLVEGESGTLSLTSEPMLGEDAYFAPLGDVDGDGRPDLAVDFRDSGLKVYSGPITSTFGKPFLTFEDVGYIDAIAEMIRSGDVNSDGVEDLLVARRPGEGLGVKYGPFTAGTTSTLQEFRDVTLEDAPAVVLDDVDLDGKNELWMASGWLYEIEGTDPEPSPIAFVAPTFYSSVITQMRGAVVADYDADGAVEWWYGWPDPAHQALPDASIDCDGALRVGDFGSGSPIDALCIVGRREVWAVAGWGAAPGSDLDRDGTEAPEDCDDADVTVHPEAFDAADGRDNDCDGAVDEVVTAAWTEVAAVPGPELNGGGCSVADFGDGWVSLQQRSGGGGDLRIDLSTGTVLLDPLSGASRVPAGDFDGDGHVDVLLDTSDLWYGPAGTAERDYLEPYAPAVSPVPLQDLDGDGDAELYFRLWLHDYELPDEYLVLEGSPDRAGAHTNHAWGHHGEPQDSADFNGDGLTDLLLDDHTVIFGDGTIDMIDRSASLTFVRSDAQYFTIHVADVDGDGQVDAITQVADLGFEINYGPFPAGTVDLSASPDWTIPGGVLPYASSFLISVPGVAMLFGNSSHDVAGGRVWGFAPGSTVVDLDHADVTFSGAHVGARLGCGAALIDLDGRPALVLPSPGEATEAYGEGVTRAYLVP